VLIADSLLIDNSSIVNQSAISLQQSANRLFALFMRRVLPAEAAELRELQPLRRLLLVLRRAVIASPAHGARQRDDVSHGCIPEVVGDWGLGIAVIGDSSPIP
jgi:hypothetical protein